MLSENLICRRSSCRTLESSQHFRASRKRVSACCSLLRLLPTATIHFRQDGRQKCRCSQPQLRSPFPQEHIAPCSVQRRSRVCCRQSRYIFWLQPCDQFHKGRHRTIGCRMRCRDFFFTSPWNVDRALSNSPSEYNFFACCNVSALAAVQPIRARLRMMFRDFITWEI